jgi:hypothetical protein
MSSPKWLLALLVLVLFVLAGSYFFSERSAAAPNPERGKLERHAAMGDAWSQYRLGLLHEKGLLGKKDLPEAYKWVVLASRSGFGVRKDLQRIKSKMNEEELEEGARRVEEFKPVGMKSISPPPEEEIVPTEDKLVPVQVKEK